MLYRLLTVASLLFSTGLFAQMPKVSSGTLQRIEKFRSLFVQPRNVYVWLPPGYPAAKSYDVLYMHDGQMLFDSTISWNKQEWQVDETAGALQSSGRARPFIVVGIENTALRLAEYFPEKAARNLPPAEKDSLEKELGGKLLGDKYLSFLVKDLKPYIDAAYATAPGRAHTFVAGSSMGGLISLYALLEYPSVFGGAACMSTHWPGSFRGLRDGGYLFRSIESYVAARTLQLKSAKTVTSLYMDRGDATLDSFYINLQPRIDSVIVRNRNGKERLVSVIFPGDDHSERSWAARLEHPLLFLFGTKK